MGQGIRKIMADYINEAHNNESEEFARRDFNRRTRYSDQLTTALSSEKGFDKKLLEDIPKGQYGGIRSTTINTLEKYEKAYSNEMDKRGKSWWRKNFTRDPNSPEWIKKQPFYKEYINGLEKQDKVNQVEANQQNSERSQPSSKENQSPKEEDKEFLKQSNTADHGHAQSEIEMQTLSKREPEKNLEEQVSSNERSSEAKIQSFNSGDSQDNIQEPFESTNSSPTLPKAEQNAFTVMSHADPVFVQPLQSSSPSSLPKGESSAPKNGERVNAQAQAQANKEYAVTVFHNDKPASNIIKLLFQLYGNKTVDDLMDSFMKTYQGYHQPANPHYNPAPYSPQNTSQMPPHMPTDENRSQKIEESIHQVAKQGNPFKVSEVDENGKENLEKSWAFLGAPSTQLYKGSLASIHGTPEKPSIIEEMIKDAKKNPALIPQVERYINLVLPLKVAENAHKKLREEEVPLSTLQDTATLHAPTQVPSLSPESTNVPPKIKEKENDFEKLDQKSLKI